MECVDYKHLPASAWGWGEFLGCSGVGYAQLCYQGGRSAKMMFTHASASKEERESKNGAC